MPPSPAQPVVILLHGIGRTRRSMAGLERFLTQHGFAVLNLDYPSRRRGIAELADHLHPMISDFLTGRTGPVHFVGYSMGGLVVRAYLSRHRPANLGYVVMLGTPNQGSEIADVLKDISLYRWFYGPAGQQLITDTSHHATLYKPVDYPLGILAGSWSLDPVSSLIMRKPGDGKVSIASTKLDGMRDHRVLPVTHTFFPINKKAWTETLHFLQHGCFTSN